MRNILFISPNPIWGGAATANLAIAKMLQDNGHNVVFNDEYTGLHIYNSVTITHTPIHQKRFLDRSLIKRLVSDNKIDCIIWSPMVAIYFCKEIKRFKKLGIKQVAIVHSLSLKKDFKGRLMDFLVSITLTHMSTIVYVSQYTMDSWGKFHAIRKSRAHQVVIHNLVNLPITNHSLTGNKPRIGFVGRLSEEKQPQIFCDLSNHIDYKFCVFGDGPMAKVLMLQYNDVKFFGQCNIHDIYSSIDVLVMTSRFENCPMVILEAKAFGIPCVAPNVGGIPELIESGVDGILYDGYDQATILSAIDSILLNYTKFSSHCLESSKKNTAQNRIGEWEKILR